MDDLKSFIREVPDFPKPGILYYDIIDAAPRTRWHCG